MDDFEADENFSAIVSGAPTRWTQLMTGMITVEDLDDEELVRGQTRGKDGRFHGTGAKNVPRAMHTEIQRRLQKRGLAKMQESYFEAIDAVADVMKSPDADPAIRLNAAKYIIERVAGKTPEKVEMSVEMKKYETILDGVIRTVPDDEGVYRVTADDGAGVRAADE